jgi:hypothetical protein
MAEAGRTELERRLADLATAVEWPPTPELAPRFEPVRPAPPRRRRALVVALATLALAVALAFAVPPARSAILRFLHLGGVTVERVESLPEAETLPPAQLEALGVQVTRAEAEAVLGAPVAVLRVDDDAELFESHGAVSTVVAAPEPVLVSEIRVAGDPALLKKAASGATSFEFVRIDPAHEGVWLGGAEHVVSWFETPPRLAGNVLLWEDGGVTYRLEGKRLTKERALALARQMLG